MTITQLLSKPEFWSALFGALAAFLLGAFATWRSNVRTKRTAGNLALISLSQMYSLVENLRVQMLVHEPIRIRKEIGRDPWSHEIRGAVALPDPPPRLHLEDLGFLVDSSDPDVLNRLLTIERAFLSMLYVVRRHETLHMKMQDAISAIDPSALRPLSGADLIGIVGGKTLIEIRQAIEELQKGLPETRDLILSASNQLRGILRVQIPVGRVLRLTPAPRARLADQMIPELPPPAWWRRLVRYAYDQLMKPRTFRAPAKPASGEPEPIAPPIKHLFERRES